MNLKLALGVLALAAGTACASSLEGGSVDTTVKLDSGIVQGQAAGALNVYLGIPYAAAPEGEQRWRAPKPVAAWSGVRQATAFGAACPQPHVSNEPWSQVGPQSEDCLFLNVWTPAKTTDARLPVMVFIHGGSLRAGSGGVPLYDGTKLADRGAVIVTINYRLGRLGFFAHPALTAENTDGYLANYGLMDQIAALKWVQRNAQQFGGDPANVTIFGESAGAVSVQALMASPEATGLFAKAISQSGGGYNITPALKQGEAAGQQWAAKRGLTAATAAQLRDIPFAEVATADALTGMMVDGRILKDSPTKAFITGTQAKVPLMIGGNSWEASLAGITVSTARIVVGGAYDELLSGYKALGTRAGGEADLITQSIAIQPSRHLAALQAEVGQPAFTYYFAQQPASERTTKPGSEHGGELSYLFGTRLNAETWDVADEKVSAAMGDYWVQFARTGNPGTAAGTAWTTVSPSAAPYMLFGPEGGMREATDLEARTYAAGVATAKRLWGSAP
jgi:para-nitrobenzyl esterase